MTFDHLSEHDVFEAAATLGNQPADANTTDVLEETPQQQLSLFRLELYDWDQFDPNVYGYQVVELTQGYFTIVSLEDYERIQRFSWSVFIQKNRQGQIDRIYGHRKARVKERRSGAPARIYLHRYLMGLTYASPSIVVDHRSGATLDTRRINLQVTSKLGNSGNIIWPVRRAKATLPRGVRKHGIYRQNRGEPQYKGRIKIRGKERLSKTIFTCPERAGRWYLRMHAAIHPTACRVNQRTELPPPIVFPPLLDDVPF